METTAAQISASRCSPFDLKAYAEIDHGYATTIHKAQGITVDRVHLLATPGLDAHATYVALSRHRQDVQLHYGRDDFDSSHAPLHRNRPRPPRALLA